jgi:hypothetical protein
VDPVLWAGLSAGPAAWSAAAVEAAPFTAPVVALAGRDSDGRAVAHVRRASDLRQAAEWCRGVPLVLVGKSLLADPVWSGMVVEKRQGTDQEAVVELRRLVAEDGLRHHDSMALSEEVTGTHVTGRAAPGGWALDRRYLAAIKAAMWAAQGARAHEPWFVY